MLANRSRHQYCSSLFLSFLFLVVVITTLVYFLQIHPSSLFSSSSPQIPHSLNLNSPYETVTLFSEHASYENLSHVYDSLWDDLLPANGGFVQKISEVGDGKGNVHVRKHKYGITMFHSLHCLGIMRGGVQELFREMEELRGELEGSRGGMEMGMGMGKEKGEGEREGGREKEQRGGVGHDFGHAEHGDPLHWLHCFDYLRQTILCNADGTLEPPRVDSRGKENVDGMIERQCRDPGELWRLSVESFEG